MALLTAKDMARIDEKIEARYDAAEVVSQVFVNESSQKRFVEALCRLGQMGAKIKVGGRRLREMVGCGTMDFARDIRSYAESLIYDRPGDWLRLGSLLVKFLEKYPEERMQKPDLDFFVWNSSPEIITEVFTSLGFVASLHEASGEVKVVNIEGENGIATFVGEDSWQTGDDWPKFGIKADFNPASVPTFDLAVRWVSLYRYQVEIPNVYPNNPKEPKRVAAVGRALLWLVTATDPDKKILKVPFPASQEYFIRTIEAIPSLLREIEVNPKLEKLYRSGLRDMAIALSIIVLTDWSYSNEIDRKNFFAELSARWIGALWEEQRMWDASTAAF
ncbi:MAG: hypothetical protein JNK26_03635 [Candidatus Doudnabacteria bacterium]|nr:hypothetical protein [Candidatus Doudnabacteria bacterium]